VRSTPLYFGEEAHPLFGWLHGTDAPARLGLVICKPFGYEAICAHRPLRHFAEAAAAVGVPALRFDYDGTLDSAGSDHDPDRLARWIDSAGRAADALRRHAGVERVCFLGVRLGALIAAHAALGRTDVDGLIAIAPVVSGRAYVRELRALQASLGLEPAPAEIAEEAEADLQEAVGFVMTSQTKAAVGGQDLLKLDRPPASDVLILDRSDLPSGEKWAERLAAQGVRVERQSLPGYVEMVFDAEKSHIPDALIAATVAWLRPRAAAGTAAPTPPLLQRVLLGPVIETAERFDGELFGVLATPQAPPSSRRGFVFVNSGAVHHVGPNRLWTTLARRWAARGDVVLRFDLSGIGDSAPRRGCSENIVYTPNATGDIAAAVARVRAQPGVDRVYALGLCSGAYNSFKAAVAGVRVDGIVCINPIVFFYKPGMSLATSRMAAEAQRYAGRARSAEAWKKFFTGKVQYRALARVLAQRGTTIMKGRARDALRMLRVPLTDDLASELLAIERQGVGQRYVFAQADPGLSVLRTDGGATVERLRKRARLRLDVIPGPDHTFTAAWAQNALIELLERD
jgi:pimeloyl-ACP methyl ester carboxylesterase